MALKIVETKLTADLVGGGNFSVGYPAGTSKGNFSGSLQHKLSTVNGDVFGSPAFFTLTFNATTVQVNWTAGSPTIKAGTTVLLQLDEPGYSASKVKPPFPELFNVVKASVIHANLGSPITADADGISAAQAIGGAVNALINGALAANGVADLDAPRNVVAVSANAGDTTQLVTFYGTDAYGVAMVETLALNGATPVVGLKAFKKVTRVAVSAAMAGNLTAGTGVKLGLPVFLPGTAGAYVLKEIYDGGAVTNGTFVAASTAKPTATTGDVRGTYSPSTAPDGAHTYEVILSLVNPEFLGQVQFAG